MLIMLNVHLKDLVPHPEKAMKSITDFLEVESEESYLKMCADKIFKNISKTQNKLDSLARRTQEDGGFGNSSNRSTERIHF